MEAQVQVGGKVCNLLHSSHGQHASLEILDILELESGVALNAFGNGSPICSFSLQAHGDALAELLPNRQQAELIAELRADTDAAIGSLVRWVGVNADRLSVCSADFGRTGLPESPSWRLDNIDNSASFDVTGLGVPIVIKGAFAVHGLFWHVAERMSQSR